jgi:hypothetical protein
MSNQANPSTIEMKLNPEQQETMRQVTGLKVRALKLTLEELEERVAPATNLNSSRSNIY